ncbi:ABC transporter permease subunit [Candidatus Phytoplasma solani]|uniref:ABC transporter permease subunit n=1 Tax=Candidatus Phytoplasma solani TaxID=69896 RepID=UPI0032DAD47C
MHNHNMYYEKGHYISGCDILLSKDLAQKLGKKLVVKHFDSLSGMSDALNEGQIDIMIGALNSTEKRKENYDALEFAKVKVSALIQDDMFLNVGDESKLNDLQLNPNHTKVQKIPNYKPIISSLKNSYYHNSETLKSPDYETKFNSPDELFRDTLAKLYDSFNDKAIDVCVIDQIAAMILPYKHILLKDKNLQQPNYAIFTKKDSPLKTNLKKALEEVLKSSDIDMMTKHYENNFLKPAVNNYLELQKLKNKEKDYNFIKKVWLILPQYQEPFLLSLMLAIDSLITGFLLTLILVRFKIFIKNFRKKSKKIIFFGYLSINFILEKLIHFLHAVPIAVQGLIVYKIFIKTGSFNNNVVLRSVYAAFTVISLITMANLTNIMMRNIELINQGQIEAAASLGMNSKQIFRYIIFEQALKTTYPYILQQFIINIKDTALFSIIGLTTLIWKAEQDMSINFDIITPFFIVSVIYLILVGITKYIIKQNSIKNKI